MCLPFPPPQSVHAQPAQFVRRKPKKEEKKPKKDGSKESLSEDGTPCYHTHGQVTCSTCKAFLGLAVAADGSGATYPLPAVEVPKKKEKPKDRKKNKEDNHKQEHNAGRRLQTVPVYYTMVNPPSEESSSASDTHDCSRTDHLHIHIPQQQKPETPETASKKSSHHSSRPKQDDEQDQHYDTYGRVRVRVPSPAPSYGHHDHRHSVRSHPRSRSSTWRTDLEPITSSDSSSEASSMTVVIPNPNRKHSNSRSRARPLSRPSSPSISDWNRRGMSEREIARASRERAKGNSGRRKYWKKERSPPASKGKSERASEGRERWRYVFPWSENGSDEY
ncbi:hypothetical protein EV356DRAFT_499955 [Viridothelium virens]|uniref:Uncharacterized protein n=1 Tax=Viridothelium virens TaxID=1048519 RepID=A0A6A6HP09_VIRVR|nr:hypothetical protein EV356DRAFT_499955 [Viridothelium virens]